MRVNYVFWADRYKLAYLSVPLMQMFWESILSVCSFFFFLFYLFVVVGFFYFYFF